MVLWAAQLVSNGAALTVIGIEGSPSGNHRVVRIPILQVA